MNNDRILYAYNSLRSRIRSMEGEDKDHRHEPYNDKQKDFNRKPFRNGSAALIFRRSSFVARILSCLLPRSKCRLCPKCLIRNCNSVSILGEGLRSAANENNVFLQHLKPGHVK